MTWFDLPNADPAEAAVLVLPLPFEGTACYGKGTALGPQAVLEASAHVELWDEEVDFDLSSMRFYGAHPLSPRPGETTEHYLQRVYDEARRLHDAGRLGRTGSPLLAAVGGEHSLTPPLVAAAVEDPDDLAAVTVVQLDAHSDLRDTYHSTPLSHACAMRRLVEKGARVLAVGIRSAEKEEFEYGLGSGRVETFLACDLAGRPAREEELLDRLEKLTGDVYLTIDIDALEVSLCPGTGTPQPGGLGWWQALSYLRRLLLENRGMRLIGCDIVETAPQPGTRVNEFTAARLLAKLAAYRLKPSESR